MSRALRVVVAFTLLGLLLPGTGEAAENIGHVIQHGHLAHAAPDGDSHESSPEHGCTRSMHLCSCCASISLLLASASEARVALGSENLVVDERRRANSIWRSAIDHPPRA